MEIISTLLKNSMSSYFFLVSWRDLIEIGFFSWLFYVSALWLKKDSEKNLLPYFYGYIAFFLVCYFGELSTITTLLIFFSPAVAMLFILMHQHLLQRNLVTLKNITALPHTQSPDWLSSLMKATLTMLSENKDIIILIEHTDAMSPFLQTLERLDVPMTDGLISLLFNKLYAPSHICWISSAGIIRGINATFKASWHPGTYQTQTAWIDDAVAYTTKTDAVIMFANAQLHRYSIAHHGSIKHDLSMEQAHQLIRKQIDYQVPLPKKGLSHGVSQTKTFAQHSP